jgi:hypothetical protein
MKKMRMVKSMVRAAKGTFRASYIWLKFWSSLFFGQSFALVLFPNEGNRKALRGHRDLCSIPTSALHPR